MPGMPAAVMGTLNTHDGVLTATGVKLLVATLPIGLFGDPFPDCFTPSHTGSTLAPVAHKLLVTGRMAATVGDPCSCGATVAAPGAPKLLIL